jgi:hypothetical protein
MLFSPAPGRGYGVAPAKIFLFLTFYKPTNTVAFKGLALCYNPPYSPYSPEAPVTEVNPPAGFGFNAFLIAELAREHNAPAMLRLLADRIEAECPRAKANRIALRPVSDFEPNGRRVNVSFDVNFGETV